MKVRGLILIMIVLSFGLSSCIRSVSSLKGSGLPEGHLSGMALQQAFVYNIMTDNCHNAANAGVNVAPDAIGIVICSGDSDKVQDLSGHTFNYKIKYLNQVKDKVDVDFYNWGHVSSCSNKSYPLDVKDSCISDRVNDFCYSSASEYLLSYGYYKIRILPVGQKVDEPTVDRCSRETKDYGSCVRCCLEKTNFWLGDGSDNYKEWEKSYSEYIKQLSEYLGDEFVNYLKELTLYVEGTTASSDKLQYVMKYLQDLESEETREAALNIMREFIKKQHPEYLVSTKDRYSEQIEEFSEQCNNKCQNRYPVSEEEIKRVQNSVCKLQK